MDGAGGSEKEMMFDFTLTQQDIDLTTEFMMWLTDRGHEYFTSDLFREAGLHECFADPQHQIGTYFSKLKANGIVVSVGEEPSEIESARVPQDPDFPQEQSQCALPNPRISYSLRQQQ